MALLLGSKTKVSVTSTTATGAIPGTSGKLLLTCNTDMYLRFDAAGDASSSNFDLFMPKGLAIIVRPRTSHALEAISAGTDGVLVIQEIE